MSLVGVSVTFQSVKVPGLRGGRPLPWVLSRPEDRSGFTARPRGGVAYLKYRLDYLFLFAALSWVILFIFLSLFLEYVKH